MPRRVLATMVEARCPRCGKVVNIRSTAGETTREIPCWKCNVHLILRNGFGANNVRVMSNEEPVKFRIIWQEKE